MKTKFRTLTLSFVIAIVLAMTTSFVLADELTLVEKTVTRQQMVDRSLEDLSSKLKVPKELIEVRGVEEVPLADVEWDLHLGYPELTHPDFIDPDFIMPIELPETDSFDYQLKVFLYYDTEYEYHCGLRNLDGIIRLPVLDPDDPLAFPELYVDNISFRLFPEVTVGVLMEVGPSEYAAAHEKDFRRGIFRPGLISDPDRSVDLYLGKLVKITYRGHSEYGMTLMDPYIPYAEYAYLEDWTCEEFQGNTYQPRRGEQQLTIRYGWNAVSLGIRKQGDMRQGFIVGELTELINEACGFDAVELVIKLKRFSNVASPWEIPDPQELIVPGEVYWVLSNSEDEVGINIDGLEIYDSQQLVLNSGWNIFSLPTANNISGVTIRENLETVGELIEVRVEMDNLSADCLRDFLLLNGCEIQTGTIYKLTRIGWEASSSHTIIGADDIIAVYAERPAVLNFPCEEVEYTRHRRPLPPLSEEEELPEFPELPSPDTP